MSSDRIPELLLAAAEDEGLQIIPETCAEAFALQEYWKLHLAVAEYWGCESQKLAKEMIEVINKGRQAIQ